MSLTNGETDKLLSTTGAAQDKHAGVEWGSKFAEKCFLFFFSGKKNKSETIKKPTQNLNLQFLPLK